MKSMLDSKHEVSVRGILKAILFIAVFVGAVYAVANALRAVLHVYLGTTMIPYEQLTEYGYSLLIFSFAVFGTVVVLGLTLLFAIYRRLGQIRHELRTR